MADWQFWIDVGGTFTDCIGRAPNGEIHTHKLLSTGRYPTTVAHNSADTFRWNGFLGQAPPGYFIGYRFLCGLLGEDGANRIVTDFDPTRQILALDPPFPVGHTPPAHSELVSPEEAPVAGIRWLLGLRLDQTIGPVQVRLGTTRATNALLERCGARTALVTTVGFADGLRIGSQDRPHLFELRVEQPPELYESVVEVNERLAADGSVCRALDAAAARAALAAVRAAGIESLAVCLLHAYRNPVHEVAIGLLAAELGFSHVSLSHQVSPLPKFTYRGDTTVLDAYLTPVLRGYCQRLAAQLPGAELRFMTSAGGLVELESFSGKDAILSGPAGGVVGTARLTERAGLAPAFAFDMGGTSTDVSRWDGVAFARRYETGAGGAAGVRRMRLQSSALEIETVAAGGGSICGFDGAKPTVGPRSAGANPGPACYGRGGPLTVTDINVHLRRIPSFPYRLDHEAVVKRLDELIVQIAGATGRRYTRDELAAGYLRIANGAMVAPIKKLAAASGADPRRHTLVAFGGAGGQHACAIARELGIETIFCSPYAGVFSAVGIGLAATTHFAERALLPGDDSVAVLVELEAGLRTRFAVEKIPADYLAPPRRMLEMRYLGQETRLSIVEPPDGDFAAAFVREHRRLFNFAFPDRAIEPYAARVELATIPAPPPGEMKTGQGAQSATTSSVRAWHPATGWELTAVHDRATLASGARLNGPAIIVEPIATVVVEPGWSAHVNAHGELRLHFVGNSGEPRNLSGTAELGDPVELELFHHRFASIAEEMGAALQRTALSTNVKERLDFSCAIFDATGALVANAAHIPVHLGAMQECVRCLRADVSDLRPGEIHITNDPFRGGSHLPDVTVVTPVFTGGQTPPAFFTASRAHHAEIGGITPGSLPPGATTLAEEGVLIRAFRYDTARPTDSDAALRALLNSGPYPSRSPAENLADIHAQIAANQTGVLLLQKLSTQQGHPVVAAYTGHLQRAAENRMRAALQRFVEHPTGLSSSRVAAGPMPDRSVPFSAFFRDSLDDGTPLALSLVIRADGSARFDFTGSGPVHPGNLNANPAIVASAVIYCLRCLLGEPVPLNAGLLAAVEIVTPPGTLLSPVGHSDPRRCPAVGGGNVETSQRLVDVIFGALGLVAASQGTMNNLLFGRGGSEAFGYYETIGGGSGAGPGFAGASAIHVHMTNTRLTDPEILETRYPVRVREWSVRRGSGGVGRWPGGDGMVRELKFLAPLSVSLLTNRRTTAAYGAAGGGSGQPGHNLFRRSGESIYTKIPPAGTFEVEPGDRLRLETPGGGGWGSELT